jgi:hypothetical protein
MMATTTPTTTAQIADPDTTPDVQQARAVLNEITGRYTTLDARRWELERALNPHIESEASADLVLDATEHLAEVRVQHARLTRERRLAETGWLLARASAREQVRTQCMAHKRALAERLNEALTLAASASREIEDIENAQRAYTNDWHISGFAWPELSAPSSAQGSRLDDWRRACRDAGLLLD